MFAEYLLFQALHCIQYPGEIAVNSGVNSRHPLSSTEPGTKTDHSYEVRSIEGRAPANNVSHQAATTVPHTGVFPGLSTSTDLRPSQHPASGCVNLPEGEESQESRQTVILLAVLRVSDGHIQVLEDFGRIPASPRGSPPAGY